MRAARLGIALVLLGASTAWGQAGDAKNGKVVYDKKCMLCHGEKGDGKGPAAPELSPAPRDFTSGVYKIRSTASKIPSDQDLFKIITDGMPGTSMPPWKVLPEKERWDLVAYLKAFAADKFKEAPKKQELAQGGRLLGGVHQARQGDVRGHRVPQVPRRRGARRRAVARGAEGRVGAADQAGQPHPALELPRRQGSPGDRHAAGHGSPGHADALLHRQRGEARGHLAPHQLPRVARAGRVRIRPPW